MSRETLSSRLLFNDADRTFHRGHLIVSFQMREQVYRVEVTFKASNPDLKRTGARVARSRSNLMAEVNGGWDGVGAL